MVSKALHPASLLVLIVSFSCVNKEELHNLLDIPKGRYSEMVVILDSGCGSCKSRFYDYIEQEWPKNTALVIRGRISQETRFYRGEMLGLDFVFLDSADHSYMTGFLDKNTEMALIKEGKVKRYTFLEYEELIRELEKD